ncbi:MAG: DNA polymerase Y family protein [Gammaproteobacteria bacterium]|jgi:protein ImuB
MAQSVKNLSLFPGVGGGSGFTQQSGSRPAEAITKASASRLWLAVCLHDLIVESSAVAGLQEPVVVVDTDDAHIAAVNPAAQMLGIGVGCALNAALAIADNLRIHRREISCEQHALRSLAIWARTLTPTVSIVEPNVLLLEIRGSLRLFGGAGQITGALHAQLARRGLSARTSLAPSAHAAIWLSRHTGGDVHDEAQLPGRLRPVPLSVTGWSHDLLTRLSEMGICHIGDLLRLPRDGLALRIGRKHLRELDQALGKAFEQREVTELPQERTFSIDLPAETDDRALLIEGCELLLERLMSELQSQQKQISRFTIRFFHLHREVSAEAFELLVPTYEQRHLFDLLTVRFERVVLPAPVISLELRTGELLELSASTPPLFSGEGGSRAGQQTQDIGMIERLRERCGRKSVFGVALASDHRPESAWSVSDEADAQLSPWAGERPLWLLPQPRPCDDSSDWQIELGPERIESGWWDGRSVNRDYYIVRRESRERLWVYFDHRRQAWYVHGVFG